jgi:hypothetical protein
MQADHVRADQAWRLRRLAFIAVFAVAIVVPSLAVTGPAQASTSTPAAHSGKASGLAPAGTLIPKSAGPRCGYGSSSGNVYTCITANGSGLHVDSMLATAEVRNAARRLQICIRGPHGTIGCYGFVYVRVGTGIFFEWDPNSNEPAGDYCANTWRENSDGSHTQIGHECINVHA